MNLTYLSSISVSVKNSIMKAVRIYKFGPPNVLQIETEEKLPKVTPKKVFKIHFSIFIHEHYISWWPYTQHLLLA